MTLRTTTALERAALGTLFLTAGPCLAGPSPPAPSIVELRQYTLQPGSRDTFITLFEREFMVDSDNVLLLRVARPTSGFASDGGAGPPGASPIAAGLFVAHIHHFDRPVTAAFLDFFDAEVRPHLNAAGIPVLASLITEQTANNFPRLPVREGEQVFVWFSSFADQAASSARGTLSRVRRLAARRRRSSWAHHIRAGNPPPRADGAVAAAPHSTSRFRFSRRSLEGPPSPSENRHHEWLEFDGTCSNRALMDGSANVEEHALDTPSGAYRAVALRAYDSKTGQWAIWWLDGRYPHGAFDPPVKGRFENGVGTFYSDYVENGKPMRLRFLWSRITPTSARWEQASSSDAGKTWDTNWIMEFRRAQDAPGATQPDTRVTGVHDFDFLRGEWRVRHRYLRAATREWVELDGTCSNRPLMGGWANLEEHWMNAPAGAYRALGLRSYDPKSARWAIWWLDGRSPHGALDPPLKGVFERDVGTFFGNTTLNGKPVGIRFIWSQITSTSARWEQAYSFDDGKTWETVWTMEFRRAS